MSNKVGDIIFKDLLGRHEKLVLFKFSRYAMRTHFVPFIQLSLSFFVISRIFLDILAKKAKNGCFRAGVLV